jgi:hypothetical protein
MENIDRAGTLLSVGSCRGSAAWEFTSTEKRKHVKSASTILFIFATENARIIVIFQNAKSRPIAFLA